MENRAQLWGPGCWAAVFGLVALAGCGPGSPVLKIDEPKHTLGKVNAGEEVPVKFVLRNTGSAPLRIEGVIPDCGCVQAEHPDSVPPGGTGEIKARFHPQIQWSGPVETRVKLRTNDKKQPEVVLGMAAEVVPILRMNPPNPIQIQYKPGQTYQKEVVMTPRPGSNVKLQAPQINVPWIHATLLPPAPTGVQRLKMTLGPMQGPSDQTGVLKFKTSHDQLSELRLTVVALALEGPVVSPGDVRLPMIQHEFAGKELIKLNVLTRTGKLKVYKVETGSDQLRAELKTASMDHFYEITLFAGEKIKPGPLKTTIKITTDDPKYPVLQVPFESIVQ